MPDVNVHFWHLVDYVVNAVSVLGIQQAKISGHLSAIKFFYRVSSSLELDTRRHLIRDALKGVARGHAQVGTQQQVRRHIASSIIRVGVTLIPPCEMDGRALVLALAVSSVFLARAFKMCAVSKNAMHAEHELRRGDAAFSSGPFNCQLGRDV